jgi:CRISPR-associated protein Cas6
MTKVDLLYPVLGKNLPSDQGYAWFSAIAREVPEFHGHSHFGLETVAGYARGDGATVIPPGATLRLRLPAESVPLALKLAGRRFELGRFPVRLGVPHVVALRPHASVISRVVTIKGFLDAEPFKEAAQRQLSALGVSDSIEVGPRRVLRVGSHTVVGFGVAVHELSDEASITLQEAGIGGRRHMGAGVFVGIARTREGRAKNICTDPSSGPAREGH